MWGRLGLPLVTLARGSRRRMRRPCDWQGSRDRKLRRRGRWRRESSCGRADRERARGPAARSTTAGARDPGGQAPTSSAIPIRDSTRASPAGALWAQRLSAPQDASAIDTGESGLANHVKRATLQPSPPRHDCRRPTVRSRPPLRPVRLAADQGRNAASKQCV